MTDAHRLPGCERELNRLSARAETRTAFGLTALAVAAAALVAAACSSEPAESTLQPKSTPSEAAAPHAVIGKAPPAIGSFPSVIILEPHAPGDFPVPREPAVMDQYGRAFFPSTLLVREGQPVEFRNSEAEPHNVHVADTSTGSTVINVGMPFLGSFRSHVRKSRCLRRLVRCPPGHDSGHSSYLDPPRRRRQQRRQLLVIRRTTRLL